MASFSDGPLARVEERPCRAELVGLGRADAGRINRRYWELCLLSELRGALRSGDV